MSQTKVFIAAIIVIVLGVIVSGTLFTVDQTQQAIVMQFGNPKRVITEPGLQFKMPFIQDVQFYEKRVLNLDPPVESVILTDQKRILVNTFARYRIENPLTYFKALRTESNAEQKLSSIINASTRGVLGNATLASVLSKDRTAILREIRQKVNAEAIKFGIAILDVRLRRADLPNETVQSVYERMKSEREREAAEYRAQGQELAQRITASADRERTVIIAEATREAEILRGQGEATRTTILSDAYGQDAEFFNFYRSMQAYEASLANDSTFLVLSPDSEFFDFFKSVAPGSEN
jgi:membrane protease subunit HflC